MLEGKANERMILALNSPAFKEYLAAPKKSFVIALLPERACLTPGINELVLTERGALKMANRHPDVSARDYRKVYFLLHSAEMLTHQCGPDKVCIFSGKVGKRLWRLVIWLSARRKVAHIVTFHRITERAFRKHQRARHNALDRDVAAGWC